MGNEENHSQQNKTEIQMTENNETCQDKKTKFKVNTNKLIEQRPRSTGFKSFLNWFKKVESLQRIASDESDSLSETSDDHSSASSTATVASFSFLPANIYKPYGDASQPEKFIASGPYTETYHRLILERNRRRNMDKNLSLRKKYSLYRSGTISGNPNNSTMVNEKTINEDATAPVVYDTFSLPSITKNNLEKIDLYKKSRRTASLSAKDKNSSTLCHVKGKRKAPPPPVNTEFTKTYRKKRQAPPPPNSLSKTTSEANQVIPTTTTLNAAFENKGTAEGNSNNNKLILNVNNSIPSSELSPKPWYKRQIGDSKTKKNNKNDSTKKKNKNEYPDIGFFRYSRIFENKKANNNEKNDLDNKQEKRSSCLLPNISELDREAAEIIKQHRESMLQQSEEHPTDTNYTRPSSAKELISKFNALTNAAKEPRPTGKISEQDHSTRSPINLLLRKGIKNNNETYNHDYLKKTPELNKKVINTKIDIKNTSNDNIKKTNTIKNCLNCGLQNTTSGNMCISCINIHLTTASKPIDNDEKQEPSQSFQAAVFSAIPSLNYVPGAFKPTNNPKSDESNLQQKNLDIDEKLKLREILKEMKNSLPKRPKPQKLESTSTSNSSELIINKEQESSATELPDIIFKSNEQQMKLDDNNVKANNSNDNNQFHPPELENIKLIGKDTYLEINSNNDRPKIVQLDRPREFISNKVSSSAQTSCVIRKNDQVEKKETDKIKPYNPAANALYTNIEETQGINPPDLKIDSNTRILLKKLETAIAEGNDLLAANLAKDLALLKVNCSVTSIPHNTVQEATKRIQIYIEDQISHQGPIPIRVKEGITINELKSQIDKELQIPTAVQRWIIGKQLTTVDNFTLVHYNGGDFNIPLFLYVVSPDKKMDEENKNKEVNKIPMRHPTVMEQIQLTETSSGNGVLSKPIITPKDNSDKLNVKQTVIKEPNKILPITKTVSMKDVSKKTWICAACTLINSLLSPLCSACGSRKTDIVVKQPEAILKPLENKNHYLQLVNLDERDLVSNVEKFECPVCLVECQPQAGVVLRECLHSFCKECLANTIKYNEEVVIKCPYRDIHYFCDSIIQEREIKALVDKKMFDKHLAKSVALAENKISNTFHCKSADCKGWCIIEENINDFYCPVCKKTNCLTCQAIHEGKNCKEYQDEINMDASTSSDGQRTKQMLEEMVSKGEAMVCPSCQVILMKKWGCDWLRCSMCKTEICWVTRGPRWGPAGKGDITGGCLCGQNGLKCHPKCNYCH